MIDAEPDRTVRYKFRCIQLWDIEVDGGMLETLFNAVAMDGEEHGVRRGLHRHALLLHLPLDLLDQLHGSRSIIRISSHAARYDIIERERESTTARPLFLHEPLIRRTQQPTHSLHHSTRLPHIRVCSQRRAETASAIWAPLVLGRQPFRGVHLLKDTRVDVFLPHCAAEVAEYHAWVGVGPTCRCEEDVGRFDVEVTDGFPSSWTGRGVHSVHGTIMASTQSRRDASEDVPREGLGCDFSFFDVAFDEVLDCAAVAVFED